MAKHKLAYALPVAAMALGAGVLVPAATWADSEACSAEIELAECVATNSGELLAGLNNKNVNRITLGGDVNTEGVTVARDITIDLGGYELTATKQAHAIKVNNGATLNLNNGKVKGYMKSSSALFNNGKAVADDVAFSVDEITEGASPFYVVTNHGEMTLNDCSAVRTTAGKASVIENGYYSYGAEHKEGENAQYPSLTINGGDYGVVSGGGVEVLKTDDAGETTINSGNFSADENTTGWLLQLSGRSLTINGGTFTSKKTGVEDITTYYCQGDEINTCNLTITGGTFNAGEYTFYDGDKDDRETFAKVNFNITGGTYKNAQVAKYVAEGYDVYDLGADGPYVVAEATEVNFPSEIFLQLGEAYAFELTDTAKKFGTLGGDYEGIAALENGVLTATKVGSGLVNFNLHNYVTPVDRTASLVVYSVTPDESDDAEEKADRDTVASYVAEQVKAMINAGASVNDNIRLFSHVDETTGEEISGIEYLKQLLVAGYELETTVVVYDDTDEPEAYDEIMGEVADNETVLKMFDAFVELNAVKDNDVAELGYVYELGDNAVTMTVELDEEVLAPADGYARAFYVIRGHETTSGVESAQRIVPAQDGTTLTFENDKFSTFAVTYVDTENGAETEEAAAASTPETGTVTAAGVSAMSAGIVTVAAVAVIATVAGVTMAIRRK